VTGAIRHHTREVASRSRPISRYTHWGSTLRISVVIPSYNARQKLETLLLALGQQRLGPEHSFEVVVVDDGSSDGTEAMVSNLDHDFDLRYIFKPRTASSGRAAARNTGIAAAEGALVVMVDADQVVPPRFLAEHARYHERHDALVVLGPRDDLDKRSVELAARGIGLDSLTGVGNGDMRESALAVLGHNLNSLATCWHFLFSCNVSVRREHLMAVGGFDEGFTGWGLEDSELGYRLRRHGLAFAYNPGATLYHLEKQPWNERMYIDWRRNLCYFSAKYDNPEIAAQWTLDRSYNPDPEVGDLSWLDSYLRFEYSVRAMYGRYPGAIDYQLVEVDQDSGDRVFSNLARRAQESDLLIIDHTGDLELAAVVQCMDTPRHILYFRQASPDDRARILATYSTMPQAGRLVIGERPVSDAAHRRGYRMAPLTQAGASAN
jgi:GT2 family glycosyltransferase